MRACKPSAAARRRLQRTSLGAHDRWGGKHCSGSVSRASVVSIVLDLQIDPFDPLGFMWSWAVMLLPLRRNQPHQRLTASVLSSHYQRVLCSRSRARVVAELVHAIRVPWHYSADVPEMGACRAVLSSQHARNDGLGSRGPSQSEAPRGEAPVGPYQKKCTTIARVVSLANGVTFRAVARSSQRPERLPLPVRRSQPA